jgi:hypothetical protein
MNLFNQNRQTKNKPTMSESQSFFADPKVMISLLALLIAIVSLVWTFSNQWEQNRKWDKLNEGNPEIREIRLQNRLEITRAEAINKNWGYKPLLYEKGEASNLFVVPYCLTLRDAITNNLISNINPIFTIPEVEQELIRIGFTGKVKIYKAFRPLFSIENMGKTELRKLSITIDAKLPDQEWKRAFTSNAEVNLTGSQSSTVYFDFELPIESMYPQEMGFKVHFKYLNYKNIETEKNIGVKWTSEDNFWSYETITE